LSATLTESPFVQVAVGRPVRGEFTYSVPEALRGKLQPGQRIRVPFGRASALGFVLGPAAEPTSEVRQRLKPIERTLEDIAALTPDVVELMRFAAKHYRYPLGEALRSALPPALAAAEDAKPAKPDAVLWVKSGEGADLQALNRAPAQHAVLSYLLAVGGRCPVEEVARAIPHARDHLKAMQKKGLLTFEEVAVVREVQEGLRQSRPAALTPEQAVAVAALIEAMQAGAFSPYLLHGVTGSGKTEVYLRLVEAAQERGKGALVLVPEIALTPQLVGRFQSRFGQKVAVLHSGLKDSQRLRHWQALRRGEVTIAVGVRSAVFAPVQNLGVVVVDEEHDPSFKQEEKLRYHARDLAVVRAQRASAVCVLGSATPSLETLENARRGRYQELHLTRRVDDRPMPRVELVDLRVARPRVPGEKEPPVLSEPLRQALGKTLAAGQQAILFLNRRGLSTFTLCEVCGQSLKCDDCDVCLTEHSAQRRLLCHYCGKGFPMPKACPSCSGPLLSLGVGTERVEAEVAEAFPQARVARLDRDAASNAEELTDLLAAFARREIDVLVGTQMVAKGHDFPGVTLVCVVLADTALSLPDFRAAERTFHLLTQVAGRAGRGEDTGRVLVQSYNPQAEPVARVLEHDFKGFSAEELRRRALLSWPPFSRMAALRIEGADPALTAQVARDLGRAVGTALKSSKGAVRMLGPAPAPLARLKGKTRWQLVVKGPTHAALEASLLAAEAMLATAPASVKVVVDVDPGAML
jgi:primosomal protein N' (replication factor Y) (superfamily II helicase)